MVTITVGGLGEEVGRMPDGWAVAAGDLRQALATLPDDWPVTLALPGGLRVLDRVEEAFYRPLFAARGDRLVISPEIVSGE